jgi:hemerythrin-like domain-containing protein
MERLKQVAEFIREHRSNESNFETLCQKLSEEITNSAADETYKRNLQDVKEKAAEEYNKAKENGGTAWPEFEKFVSDFEKAVVEELKKEG